MSKEGGQEVDALQMTPAEHLIEACKVLDGVRLYGGRSPGAADLSTYAVAHLIAAQVKTQMGSKP